MAGKTFPGMGELEDQSADPADAGDSGATPAPSGPYYSGPTVVDDVKVEEGLQKLRALDAPPAAVAGAIDTAAEIVESGANQIPARVQPSAHSYAQPSLHAPIKDGGRGTYIGHSVVDVVSPVEPEKPYDDRMRGTLYGHMLHLPELKLPAPEEPNSRELTIVDQSAPTSQALEVYHPDAARAVARDLARRAAAAIPQEAEAFPRSDRYRSIPVEVESPSHNKILLRVGIAAAAIAAIVGAAVIWLHTSTEEPELQARPAVTVPQPASPPVAPPVVAPAPAVVTPPAAAAVDVPAEPVVAKPPREAARPTTERARSVPDRPAPSAPAAAARPEHHRPSAPPAADTTPKARSGKRPSAEDDPDGTLAPSIE